MLAKASSNIDKIGGGVTRLSAEKIKFFEKKLSKMLRII